MGWTPYHAFPDKIGACGTKRLHGTSKLIRDVAGSMRARSKIGHAAQVSLFRRSKPVEANPEKTLVQSRHGLIRSVLNITLCNRRLRGYIPSVLSPFLQKVGVPLSLHHDGIKGFIEDFNPFVCRWLDDRLTGIALAQWSNIRKVEQPLGIGFGIAHLADELRKTSPYHRYWQLFLRATVKRRNQRRHLNFRNILKFVNEENQDCPGPLRRRACLLQQRSQIRLQIPVIGQSRLDIEIQTDLNVVVGNLQLARKPGQRPEAPNRRILCSFYLAEAQEGEPQLRGKKRRKRSIFWSLDPDRVHTAHFRIFPHLIEQDSFANAAQTHHHHALGRSAKSQSLDAHLDVSSNRIATGKFRRRTPGAGSIWICDRVHGNTKDTGFIDYT